MAWRSNGSFVFGSSPGERPGHSSQTERRGTHHLARRIGFRERRSDGTKREVRSRDADCLIRDRKEVRLRERLGTLRELDVQGIDFLGAEVLHIKLGAVRGEA